jgi:aspartate carbamoyltransferase
MIDIQSLSLKNIDTIFETTDCIKYSNTEFDFKNLILCNAFFEPSTRTSLSFETAMLKLGGKVINFNPSNSSINKGETFYDTMKTIEQYSDIIVLRHPDKNKIYEAKNFLDIPIINGGNGKHEHPTQALLDLYTISKNFDLKNDSINICFIGDIKHSRTIHSLINILYIFNVSCSIHFLCYPSCQPDMKSFQVYNNKFEFIFIDNLDNIHNYDLIYSSRVQKERFTDDINFDISKYQLNTHNVSKMKPNSIILHALPRNDEISPDIDNDHRSLYFKQLNDGVLIRMSIIYCIIFKLI